MILQRLGLFSDKLLPRNGLLRLLAINGLIGVFISILVLFGLMAMNVGNLRSLIAQAENPFLPLLMLAIGLIITLTSVVMGSAVMFLSSADNNDKGGRRQLRIRLEPVAVTVAARGSRRF